MTSVLINAFFISFNLKILSNIKNFEYIYKTYSFSWRVSKYVFNTQQIHQMGI